MEHDEEEDMMSSSYSLEDLLEFLRLPDQKSTNMKYSILQFYNTILTKSRIPRSIDFFLWIIFYIFIEVIVSSTSLQTKIFSDLNPISFENSQRSTNSLFSKVLAQLSTVSIFVLTILIIIFQIPLFTNSFSIGHLKATFLHLSLVHVPMILTPAYGILFGVEIMSTVGTESNDHSGTYYGLLASISFISILCSTCLFTSTTWNKLTITNHPFEYWEFPYGFIDLIFFFLQGTFFPIRNSLFEKSIIGFEIIQFSYGWYFVFKRRQYSFIYLTPNFIEAKIGTDFINFSVVSLLNLFINFSSLTKISLIFITHFIDMIVASVVVSRNKVLGTSILKHRSFTVDRRHITTSFDAVTMIRSGLMLTAPKVADIRFITWIASYRFSPKILPDLYRICLVLNRPLNSIKIPVTAFGALDVLSFQFLAFQVDSYLRMIDEKNPEIQSTVDHLNLINEKMESMLNKFWTTEDYDQITIYKLGYHIYKAKARYEEALFNFPLSQKIHEIHKKFAIEILKMPAFIAEEHKNPYFYILYPKKTIYSFLADKTRQLPHLETRPKLTANEKTADSMIYKGSKMLILFFRIMVILTIVFILLLWIAYYNQISSTWEYFINITHYQQANIALATKVLLSTDKTINIPNAETVQMIIGIPLEAAALFRAPIVIETRFGDIFESIQYQLPFYENDLPFANTTCNKISFSSLISYSIEEDININHRRCYLLNTFVQMDSIDKITNDAILSLKEKIKGKYSGFTIIQFVISLIIFLIFILLFILLRINHKKLLSAIRLVLSSKPNYHENEYLDYQFWICPTLTLVIFSILGTLGMFLSYVYTSSEKDRFVSKIINETVSVCQILIGLEKGLTLTEFSIQDELYRNEYEDMILNECINVYNSVNNLTISHFSQAFENIPPLNNWTIPNRKSYSTVLLDICKLMLQKNQTEESFDFLAARAFFMYNVTILTSETLPQMYESAHYAMLMTPSHFWWISMAIFLVTILLHIIYVHFLYKRMRMWFVSALIILLRNNKGDLKNLIERKKVSFPDLAPFPILIKNRKSNIIMYANPATTQYTNLSIGQLIGQELNNVWEIGNDNIFSVNGRKVFITETVIDGNNDAETNDNVFDIRNINNSINENSVNNGDYQNINLSDIESITSENDNDDLCSSSSNNNNNNNNNSNSSSNNNRYGHYTNTNDNNNNNDNEIIDFDNKDECGLSMILFNDITEINEIEEKCKNLIRQTRIKKVQLPAMLDMIAIEIRINADLINTDRIFDVFSSCEKKCSCMIRIACGPSFYTGFVQSECNFLLILKFIYEFLKRIDELPVQVQNQPARSSLQLPGKISPFASLKPPPIITSNSKQIGSLPKFNMNEKPPNSPLVQNINLDAKQDQFIKSSSPNFNSDINLNSNLNFNQNMNINLNFKPNQNPHYSASPLASNFNKNENNISKESKGLNSAHIIISAVHSTGKVISLCGNNAVGLLCGKAAQRGHDCVLNGVWGRIYIDFDLLESVNVENINFKNKYAKLLDKVIQIGDSAPQQNS